MALFFYKEKNKDIRAAAYLRLSIEDGDKAESNSIGNQRELIRDFAAERPGLHLVEEYADDGYTGTNFERPGFKRMMEDIKSGKINCIIVKDLSRLGRNYIEMGKYLEQIFPMMGIRFIAINDNYDNANTESSDSDSIVVPFKNLLNDSYCRDISIKVRSQLDMKRRKGEFIGGYAIYGYCKDERNKNRLVVDEYAADIVRSIYRRKLEGMSAQAIAEQLNSENVLAPSEYKRLCGLNYHSGFKAGTHAKWQAIQVLRILKNEVYTGTMVQGRRQKINYKIKKIRDVEESGWIRVPNMHEAIIPQKLFDTVQEVLKLDTCASKGQQAVNLFSGIVRCGGCGQNMVRRTVSKNGKKYIYLHCVTNHNGLGCSSHLISESKLAEVVLAALQGKVQQISGLEHRLDEINEIPKNERRLKSVEEHLKMLEQEEQKYQTLRRQLYEDMSSGIVSKEEYKEFSHSFNEKVETIRKAKAEMKRQRDCLNNLDVEHNFDTDIERENIKPKPYRYILIYDCKLTEPMVKQLQEYAKKNDLKIIGAGDYKTFYDEGFIDLTPYEWVDLFRNAEKVITGTFHGTVFSIKYNKSVLCYPTEKNRINKIRSLLSDMKIASRLLKVGCEDEFIPLLDTPMDYTETRNYIAQKIQEADDFLTGDKS